MSERLIERLKQLDPSVEGQGFSVTDFAYARGTVLDALVYLSVIWPRFVETSGIVLREVDVETKEDRDRVREALDRLPSKGDVERSFNWVDVGVLFAPRNSVSTSDEDLQLAEALRETWSAKLQQDFPGRDFTVEVIPPGITGGSHGVRFFENP